MTNPIRGDKSICLPVASEAEYKAIIADNNLFREYILQTLEKYPERSCNKGVDGEKYAL